MPARRIVQLGDPLLRAVSSPVRLPEARRIIGDLRDTLRSFRHAHGFGRGISAVQIGEPKRLIYIELEGTAYALLNPAWESRSAETFRMWDDCFSFPNLMAYVERHRAVRLRYQDPEGRQRLLEASGGLAELLQHEMDHLDGVLAIDRALGRDALATREEWERQRLGATGVPAAAS